MPLGLEEWDEEYEEVWADIRNTNPTAYSITLPSPETREKRLIEAMVSSLLFEQVSSRQW